METRRLIAYALICVIVLLVAAGLHLATRKLRARHRSRRRTARRQRERLAERLADHQQG